MEKKCRKRSEETKPRSLELEAHEKLFPEAQGNRNAVPRAGLPA